MIEKALELINKNTIIHSYRFGEWGESDNHIEMPIYSPTSHSFGKGDIYFRPSENGKGVRVQIFDGEGTNFYDQGFGSGIRHWNASVVDINNLVNVVSKYPDVFNVLQSILTNMDLPIH